MIVRRVTRAFAAAACLLGACLAPGAQAAPVFGPDMSCVAPAGDPAPGTPAWFQRDTQNQYCASLRNRDQLNNPAFGLTNLSEGASLYIDQASLQFGELNHIHGGTTTLIRDPWPPIPSAPSSAGPRRVGVRSSR